MDTKDVKNLLVKEVANLPAVKAIGQTGDDTEALIPGRSDIDMFVLCTEIPSFDARKSTYEKFSEHYSECMMEVCSGGIWGYGDILMVNGIDVMFMYFTIPEMSDYLDEILDGKHLDKDGGFYPVGRLATIKDMHILYEENEEFTSIKKKVEVYPEELARLNLKHHLDFVLDSEDIGRTLLRKEVLFYHMVLENALDHFLQALYALNRTYFPSRKRIEKYIGSFELKPDDCYNRLLAIVRDAAMPERIEASVEELTQITSELRRLAKL